MLSIDCFVEMVKFTWNAKGMREHFLGETLTLPVGVKQKGSLAEQANIHKAEQVVEHELERCQFQEFDVSRG